MVAQNERMRPAAIGYSLLLLEQLQIWYSFPTSGLTEVTIIRLVQLNNRATIHRLKSKVSTSSIYM